MLAYPIVVLGVGVVGLRFIISLIRKRWVEVWHDLWFLVGALVPLIGILIAYMSMGVLEDLKRNLDLMRQTISHGKSFSTVKQLIKGFPTLINGTLLSWGLCLMGFVFLFFPKQRQDIHRSWARLFVADALGTAIGMAMMRMAMLHESRILFFFCSVVGLISLGFLAFPGVVGRIQVFLEKAAWTRSWRSYCKEDILREGVLCFFLGIVFLSCLANWRGHNGGWIQGMNLVLISFLPMVLLYNGLVFWSVDRASRTKTDNTNGRVFWLLLAGLVVVTGYTMTTYYYAPFRSFIAGCQGMAVVLAASLFLIPKTQHFLTSFFIGVFALGIFSCTVFYHWNLVYKRCAHGAANSCFYQRKVGWSEILPRTSSGD